MSSPLSTSFLKTHSEKIGLGLCLAVLFCASLLLPSLFSSRYASPDETAVAITSEKMIKQGIPRVPEPLAVQYPWLHARSWVSNGTAIVPVGFLGWPLLLVPWRAVLGDRGLVWAGWLILLSSFYPFYKLLRAHFSSRAAWIGVVVMAASPAVILYANRSLFPNTGVIAAALWSVWLLHIAKQRPRLKWVAGIVCGFAIMIRPTELLWLLPWWIYSWKQERKEWRKHLSLFLPIIALVGIFLVLNAQTYGSWSKMGYWLRDNPIKNTKSILISSEKPALLTSILPFGLHPKNIAWNVRAFGQGFLWPIILIIIGAAYLRIQEKWRTQSKEIRVWIDDPMWLGAWTIFVLLVMYGSGIYQDHVQVGAVTVGNSFLRYLLPLAPLAGLAAAYGVEKTNPSRLAAGIILVLYVGFGLYAALYKDDEGVWKTRQELKRYAEVLEVTKTYFPPGSVIVSDRSDKLFTPYLRGISPRPSIEQVVALTLDKEANVRVGLYARPVSQAERDAWRREGVELINRGVFAREHLYELIPR